MLYVVKSHGQEKLLVLLFEELLLLILIKIEYLFQLV